MTFGLGSILLVHLCLASSLDVLADSKKIRRVENTRIISDYQYFFIVPDVIHQFPNPP